MEIKIKKEKNISYISFITTVIVIFLILAVSFILDIKIDLKYVKCAIGIFTIILAIIVGKYIMFPKYETWLEIDGNEIKLKSNKYKFDELLMKKEKRKYYTYIAYRNPYFHRMAIRDEFDFFYNNQYLFTLDDVNHKQVIDILKDKIKIDDGFVNDEKILELKPQISEVVMYMGSIAITILGLILFIFLNIVFEHEFTILILIVILVLILEIYYIRRELKQFVQKVYWIKDKGFYVEKDESKKFYKFNEIDKGETEFYLSIEPVEHTIRLYKNDEKILELTNSSNGFYDFLAELKDRKIIE